MGGKVYVVEAGRIELDIRNSIPIVAFIMVLFIYVVCCVVRLLFIVRCIYECVCQVCMSICVFGNCHVCWLLLYIVYCMLSFILNLVSCTSVVGMVSSEL